MILEKARELLLAIPLCDRCLGRAFALLGQGLSNKERGAAIKTVLVMSYHSLAERGEKDEFRRIAPNIGAPAAGLYRRLFGEDLEHKPCYICGGELDRFIEDAATKGASLLKAWGAGSFVVGVRLDPEVEKKEHEIIERFSLARAESIRREIKREVGKRIAERGLTVDFSSPEVMLLLSFPSGEMSLTVSSLLLRGKYWKRGRMISQAYWPTVGGPRYYSIEEALWPLLRITGGEGVAIHAAGREDVDARMLGSGRPILVEIKAPRRREVNFREIEKIVKQSSGGVIELAVFGRAKRELIAAYKEEAKVRDKIYRAVVVFGREVGEEELAKLESSLADAVVEQYTPTRVLHRRADALRIKRVKEVRCVRLSESVAECLIWASGGLYIKELISGDGGRTRPSFSELLGTEARCVELDVLFVSDVADKLSQGSILRDGGAAGGI